MWKRSAASGLPKSGRHRSTDRRFGHIACGDESASRLRRNGPVASLVRSGVSQREAVDAANGLACRIDGAVDLLLFHDFGGQRQILLRFVATPFVEGAAMVRRADLLGRGARIASRARLPMMVE